MSLEQIALVLCLLLTIWITIGIRRSRKTPNWLELIAWLKTCFIQAQYPNGDCPIPLHQWSDLSAWPESLQALLKRTSHQLHFVEIEQDSFGPICVNLGGHHHSIPCEAEVLAKAITDPAAKLVMIAHGAAVMPLLKMLHQYPGIRDHLLMVIAVDPIWEQDWLETNFTHEAMDAEASRQIIYLCLYHEPTAAKLLCPEIPPTGWNSIAVFDVEDFPKEDNIPTAWVRILSILINRVAC